VGGTNQVKVFRTDDFSQVATIPVGRLPHGLWPSGDGSRMYVGLENDDALAAIDTASNQVVATIPVGQAPQAVVYVPMAAPEGASTAGLQPLGAAGQVARLSLLPVKDGRAASVTPPPTSVALFEQGLLQVLQASATGLDPKKPYVLALAQRPDGSGTLQALANFMSNPAGSAIVNAVGPVRQLVQAGAEADRRYLVIAPRTEQGPGAPVQVQAL